ncbi:MAG: protein translocase subunit SecF [Candidatus Gracilibacteria bacterium]|jgi:SecD/SecF fusion protein
MKRYLTMKLAIVIIVALFLGFYSLPPEAQKKIIPFAPESITKIRTQLGLDLQGGSQLDYKLDLRKVPEADRQQIIEGVQKVIEKRVNGLGVSEPNIFTSDMGGETHIVVELAQTATIEEADIVKYLGKDIKVEELTTDEKKLISLEKAKDTVGKTIQLEFKEEKGEVDPQEEEKVRALADEALAKIKGGADFSVTGQEEQQAFPGKVKYQKAEYTFESQLDSSIKDKLTALKVGDFTRSLVETGGSFIQNDAGQMVEDKGLAIIKLVDAKEEVKNEKEIYASHILIAYQGSERADASVTRTKEEAYTRAKEVKEKLKNGGDFAVLAQEYSDDKSNKETGGKLDIPVTGDGTYAYEFEQGAQKLKTKGEISDIVESPFGYHLIKATDIKENAKEKQYKYETITFSLLPDPWKETGLTGKQFVRAEVQLDNFYQPYVTIQFNDEGAKLFEDITSRNVNKRVAIFVGGELISAPNVNEKISGGSAQITGRFTTEEAEGLARDLNTGAIPAPIVLAGEYTIGATLGQEALSDSLWAGAIALLLIMVFMIAIYKVPGIMASVSLLIYLAINLFIVKSQLHFGLAILISLCILGYLVYKILNSEDSGWEKFISFIFSCAAFFFLTFLLKSGIVMTLAGVAGFIISMGMALDANVLIFERIKEELRDGKTYKAALDAGFYRAWSAIRDSNFTTLIACILLFIFGSSMIKGYAFTLAVGILVSMFTAITITKLLLTTLVGKKITENLPAMGVKAQRKDFNIKFIQNSKKFLGASAIAVGLSVVLMLVFGLNLGIDFKGGTLLEYQFNGDVSKETLTKTLVDIEKEVNGKTSSVTTSETADEGTVIKEEPTVALDLTTAKVIESGKNHYIIKAKYITSDTHDKILELMKTKLPEFTELRFTTIGPVVGQSMLKDSIIALMLAILGIILYVALAFRKLPKSVKPWRFGVASIVALLHNVILVTGVFVVLGMVLNVEIDALFITAMLTIFGYSVNDTIVIFDRMRDNLLMKSKDESLDELANKSLNQTLTRSLNTGITTFVAMFVIMAFGNPSIFYFILALTLGIAVGTYTSICVASPMLVMWNNWSEKKRMEKSNMPR